MIALFVLLSMLQPAPLALQANASRSEFVRGDFLTVSAYLYNDSAAPIDGRITIAAPAGVVALSPEEVTGQIAADRALHVDFSYRIEADAPKGLARFVVRSGGLVREVWVRVGPIESKPPPHKRLWLAMVRA